MSLLITGLGTALPEHTVPQMDTYTHTREFCCETDEHRRVMELIYQGSGVSSKASVVIEKPDGVNYGTKFFLPRHDLEDRGPTTNDRMQQYEQHALPLALQSSQAALSQAGQDLSEITHLVTVSCSGFSAPGFDIGLIEELGLSRDCSRTHVGFMGCHGSFNGLRVAKGYVEADPSAVVLMCSVELCSLHYHYGWSIEKVIANALFADGSAAVVCRSGANKPAQTPKYELIRNASHLLADSSHAMSWKIGDHGFEMTLSQKVPSMIDKHLAPWMSSFLAKEGLTIQDVKGWAIHPGGPRILDACLSALSLSGEHVEAARETLSAHGNMSSATVLFLLNRLKQQPIQGPVVALGFGPGLTIEAMLLRSET